MPEPAVNEFARKVIQLVRDYAIEAADVMARQDEQGRLNDERWQAAAKTGDVATLLHAVIPDVVDHAAFYLFHAIDNEEIQLVYRADDGTSVELSRAGWGELAGELMGTPGLRHAYATQRFTDYFPEFL